MCHASCLILLKYFHYAQQAGHSLQAYILSTSTADDNPLFYNRKIEREFDSWPAALMHESKCIQQPQQYLRAP